MFVSISLFLVELRRALGEFTFWQRLVSLLITKMVSVSVMIHQDKLTHNTIALNYPNFPSLPPVARGNAHHTQYVHHTPYGLVELKTLEINVDRSASKYFFHT